MPKKQPHYNYVTIADALKRVEQQKELYERNLVGKSFIYTYLNNNNDFAECVKINL